MARASSDIKDFCKEALKSCVLIFNDPIHGSIELHPFLVRIIDTPQFQRLRDISQMGSVYFVYPGASHNRFEHSIGVAHLAGELVRALNKQYHDEPDRKLTEKVFGSGDNVEGGDLITRDEGLCVQIAALCHDLGHGPFSHMFDQEFLPRVIEIITEELKNGKIEAAERTKYEEKEKALKDWTHEKQSTLMLTALINDIKKQEDKTMEERKEDPKGIDFVEKIITIAEKSLDLPKLDDQSTDMLKALIDPIKYQATEKGKDDRTCIKFTRKVLTFLEEFISLPKQEQSTLKEQIVDIKKKIQDQTMERKNEEMKFTEFMDENKTFIQKLIDPPKTVPTEYENEELTAVIDDIKKLISDRTMEKRKGDFHCDKLLDNIMKFTDEVCLLPKEKEQSTLKLKKLIDDMKKQTQAQTKEKAKGDPECTEFMKKALALILKLIVLLKKKTHLKSFLYEIVSNQRNGIDVDKMDYFARDCYHLGIQSNFDHKRFFKFARVCLCDDGMQICLRDKDVDNIYALYHTRNAIHVKACQHRVVTAIDEMIVDAMLKADKTLEISNSACNVDAFLKLTDGIFQKILDYPNPDDSVKEAQNILRNLKIRNLYKCVHVARTKGEADEDKKFQDELNLKTGEFGGKIGTRTIEMKYGMDGKDPIEQVKFYSKLNRCEARFLKKHEVSQFFPSVFYEEVRLIINKMCDKVVMA